MWTRLRWPFKALLIALPILLFVYVANKFNWINKVNDLQNTTTNTVDNNSRIENNSQTDGSKKSGSGAATTIGEKRIFGYQAEAPIGPVMKGVVEVGASGFNSFVVNIDKQKRWAIVSKDFGKSFVYEGLATTDDIRKGLRDYISNMGEKGVMSKNIHFVVSSGAMKEAKTPVIISELKKMGFVVNTVTPEQEGKLALKSVLPRTYYDNSFVVDIGSGNTKISYPTTADATTAIEAPGAKYYEKGVTDAEASAQVKAAAAKIPANKREVCFIIGGVPFELAKAIRTDEERYTVLMNPEEYNFPEDKKKVICGLNIYKAIKEATNCDTFVFDWDANFSIGFLLGLP
jgi:hypothetical protein